MSLDKFNLNAVEFGERFNQIRRKHNLKQVDISDQLGISRGYISAIGTGRVTPGISLMRGLKQLFKNQYQDNRTYDWWIDGIDLSTSIGAKNQNDEVQMYKSMIADKDSIILMLREKLANMEMILSAKK